jgi:molybdenum cofactor cytidylyltransferase
MLSSYQAGVRRLLAGAGDFAGTLLELGDQPHVPVPVVQAVLEQARRTPDSIVMPRFEGRRGHPFYFPHRLWLAMLALGQDETLRTIVRGAGEIIQYAEVETDAILRDIDTPNDYRQLAAQDE